MSITMNTGKEAVTITSLLHIHIINFQVKLFIYVKSTWNDERSLVKRTHTRFQEQTLY